MASATEYSKLRNDERIERELLAASIAFLVSQSCETLELRKFILVFKAMSLNNHAMGLGYTADEVKNYVSNPLEQHRFRQQAISDLGQKGVKLTDKDTFCTVGRKEIEQGSLVGSLLYGRNR